MNMKCTAALTALCLLFTAVSCGKPKTAQKVSLGSPTVITSDGSSVQLKCSYTADYDFSELDESGVRKVCKAAGVPENKDGFDSIWFGENVFGGQLASVVYFEKYARDLTGEEWKTLAQIAASPEKYSSALTGASEISGISSHAQYASRIPESAYFDAMVEEIAEDITEAKKCTRSEAFRLIYADGVKIESAYSPTVQQAVDAVYSDNSVFSEGTGTVPQSACAVMDYDGNVLALAGGNNGNTAYNRAYRIPHSTGSSIKPLSVYTPAIRDNLLNFSSLVSDEPMSDAGTDSAWPRNYNNIYDGDITVTYALRQSKNTIPVKLVTEMGADNCCDFLRDELGFETLTDNDRSPSSVALGYLENGVPLTTLCGAYEMFGNGGSITPPSFYKRVTDGDGNVIIENAPVTKAVLDTQTSWIMNRLLYYNVCKENGIAGAANLSDGSEVIGKTGTVDNSSGADTDRLFVGGTPQYLAAVWVGFDSRSADIDGLEYNAPTVIWKAVMEKIPRTEKQFTPDDTVIAADYCTESGELAGDNCPDTEVGYYKPECMPEECGIH